LPNAFVDIGCGVADKWEDLGAVFGASCVVTSDLGFEGDIGGDIGSLTSAGEFSGADGMDDDFSRF